MHRLIAETSEEKKGTEAVVSTVETEADRKKSQRRK